MLSNYSRSYILSFPAPSTTWFYSGASPQAWTGPSFNYLSGTPATGKRPVTKYSDKTQLNYRKIVIADTLADGIQSWTITGMTKKGMVTETIIVPSTAPFETVNYYSYLTFIGSNESTGGVTIGNGLGYSPWILHDGSGFSGYVKVSGGAINWTIEGTLDKWNASVSNKFSPDGSAQIYDPLAINLHPGLTAQTTSTTYPVSISFPVEAIRLLITDYPAGTIEFHFSSQNLL